MTDVPAASFATVDTGGAANSAFSRWPDAKRPFADSHAARPPALPPQQLPRVSVRLLTGASAGKTLELVKALTTLGKPGVQVAVIARRPEGVFVTHVEGDSFPVVNGRAIGGEAHALKDKDVVEIAGIRMELAVRM
jgi:hypothetical protein